MKIKMTYDDMFGILRLINKFSYVSGALAIAMHRTRNRLDEEFQIFMEERDKLIKKYGTEDENGQLAVDPGSENFSKFTEELLPLLRESAEIEFFTVSKEVFEKSNIYDVPQSMLDKDSKDAISFRDFDMLEQLFTYGPQDNK